MIDHEKLQRTVKQVLDLLVSKDYVGLEALTEARRLAASDLELAVEQYGRQIAFPPCTSHFTRDLIEVDGSSPREWSVYVDLWTEEEGRSDLTLELRLFDSPAPVFRVEIDDLHVL